MDQEKYLIEAQPLIFDTSLDKHLRRDCKKNCRHWKRLHPGFAKHIAKVGKQTQAQAGNAAKTKKAQRQSKVTDKATAQAPDLSSALMSAVNVEPTSDSSSDVEDESDNNPDWSGSQDGRKIIRQVLLRPLLHSNGSNRGV